VLAFSSFFLRLKHTDQKQLRIGSEVMFRTKMQRIKSERERRKTQSNYTGSFHKPEVVMSPLHFQGEFTKNVISDYKFSSTTARDFQCSRTRSRDF